MTKLAGIDHSMDGLDRIRAECRRLIPGRVTVVVRYAFGSAIVVPACGPGEAGERVLHPVLGVAYGPGYPVSDGEQQRPVLRLRRAGLIR
jgi:hypothetical protein